MAQGMLSMRALALKTAMGMPVTLGEVRAATNRESKIVARTLANPGTAPKKRKHSPNRMRHMIRLADGGLVCLHPTKGYLGVYGRKGTAKKSRRSNRTGS